MWVIALLINTLKSYYYEEGSYHKNIKTFSETLSFTKYTRLEGSLGNFNKRPFYKFNFSKLLHQKGYQLISTQNHGFFPCYFKRFNLRNISCLCGEENADHLHYIRDCPHVQRLSNQLLLDSSEKTQNYFFTKIGKYLSEHLHS